MNKIKKVFLITGFQNWGKTFLIRAMFNGTKRYSRKKLYQYLGKDFCVETQSNDDLGRTKFEQIIRDRLAALKDANIEPEYICAAFCPTREEDNLSDEIIKSLFPTDEVYIIAIKHKWCLHGKLQIENIKQYYSNLNNVNVVVLEESDAAKKSAALQEIIKARL